MKTGFFYTCLILFLLLCAWPCSAQNKKIDSLKKVLQSEKEDTNKVNTLIELGRALRQDNDCINALKILDLALGMSVKMNLKTGKGDIYHQKGLAYQNLKNFPEAMKNYTAALEIRLVGNDKSRVAITFERISDLNYLSDNYPEGLKNAFSGLKYMEESGEKNNMSHAYGRVAFMYYSENNLPEAMKYYILTCKTGKEIGDIFNTADAVCKMGDIYFKQNNYDSALKNYAEAIRMIKDTSDPDLKSSIANALAGMGDVYHSLGKMATAAGDKAKADNNFNLALNNYFAAVKVYETVDQVDGTIFAYVPIGEIFIQKGKSAEAKKYIYKSIELAKASGSKDNLIESYSGLVEWDSAVGNYKKAFEDHKMYILYRDSLNNQNTANQSLEYSMQYEADKKNAIAKAEQEKKDALAKHIRNQEYFAMASLAVLVLAGLIIALIQYRNNKQKQKANFLLERQKQKVEITLNELKSTQVQLIQSEKMASLGELTAGIAHEIQNPLNFVNNFSDVNTELIDELEQEAGQGNLDEVKAIARNIRDNEQKINHHGKRADAIVKGMLQHSRTSSAVKEPTGINKLADEYLRLAYHGLRAKDKSFNATLKTDYDETIGNINIVPQDIGRVILNLITNAFYTVNEKRIALAAGAKNTQPDYEPTVSVSTKKIGDQVLVSVKDNGNGVPPKIADKIFQPFFTTKPTGQGTGLGLSLSYDIVKAHGGELKMQTTEGEGTVFMVQLPVV
jgi:two-component system, NtrC family, sensor kinase